MKIIIKATLIGTIYFAVSISNLFAQTHETIINLGASDDEDADFNNTNPIYLAGDGYGWEHLDMYKENQTNWYPYIDFSNLPAGGDYITMRKLNSSYSDRFYSSAIGFQIQNNANQNDLYLTIRYKDINFNPSTDRFYGASNYPNEGPGVSVLACSTREGSDLATMTKIGSIGGEHDFQWKTKTFIITAGSLPVVDNEFSFKLSPRDYGRSDVYGGIYLDWIKLSEVNELEDNVDFDEAYDETPGFWPEIDINSRFTNFAQTGIIRNDEPYYPIGLFTVAAHFYWANENENYMQNARDIGFNLIIYNGWEAHTSNGGWFWGDKDATRESNYELPGSTVSTPYPARYLGLPNFLDEAANYDLLVAPLFTTDMWRYYIQTVGATGSGSTLYGAPNSPYNGTWPGVVEALKLVVDNNKDHPQLFSWYIKDEADHINPYWGSPVETVRDVYKAVTENDGEHPCTVTMMGWRSQMFRFYKNTYDIGAYDRYPRRFDGQANYSNNGEWAEEFKHQTDDSKPYIAIIDTEQNQDLESFIPIVHARINTYMALIHGAQGLLFFNDPGPNVEMDAYNHCGTDCGPQWWADFQILINEVNQLSYTALHNSTSTTLGYSWGTSPNRDIYPISHTTNGEGTTSNEQIHAVYKQNNETHNKYLVAVNAYEATTNPVFTISNLEEGDVIQVLFEDRTITAEDGQFTDEFTGGQTHVYQIGANATAVLEPTMNKTNNICVFPNPLKTESRISLDVRKESNCQIYVFNIQGKEVKNLFNGKLKSGNHEFVWNGTDNNGELLSNGEYIIKVNTNTNSESFKLMILK